MHANLIDYRTHSCSAKAQEEERTRGIVKEEYEKAEKWREENGARGGTKDDAEEEENEEGGRGKHEKGRRKTQKAGILKGRKRGRES